MDVSPLASRQAALEILVSCLDKGQPLDEALARHAGFASLDPRDRAFVRLLLATTLRRLGEIDVVLATLVERPLEGPNTAGRQVLRLGAAQLLFLGTAPHAAVDTSVRLIEDAHLPHLKGLANAVLRRISRDGVAILGDRDPARLNTPQWLWQSWAEAYGEDTTRAIAAAHLIEAPLDLTPRSNTDFWAGQLEAEVLPTGTLRRTGGGHIAELPGFAEGTWWVQDAAAMLPVRLLGDITGKRVADLCAAPGGKTLQLCAAGAAVTAVDISARRMIRVGENLARAGAFDPLDANRARVGKAIDLLLRAAQQAAEDRQSRQVTLFGDGGLDAARGANTGNQVLTMAAAAGLTLGDDVAAAALATARAVLEDAPVTVEVLVVDRAGFVAGAAGGW